MRREFCFLLFAPALLCARGASAADADTLVGIHWWGLKPGTNSYSQGIDAAPADMLDSRVRGAWDVEVVNTHGDPWQKAPFFAPLYADLYRNKNVSFVTRVEHTYGRTVPAPATIDTAAWAGDVVSTINQLKDFGHVWQLGNEPNLIGEGNGWANNQITPAGYANVYKTVRDRVRAQAQVGAPGAHQVLVAPVSPGGVIAGVRWKDGNQWLGETIDAVRATGSAIDGFGLHAYGGGATTADALRDFRNGFAQQIAVIDAKGQTDVPIHITEMNRGVTLGPGNAGEETRQAEFARGVMRMIDRWNRTPGNHNVVSANWFVYDGLDPRWDGFGIEYWKDHGNPSGSPNDLYTAYAEIARTGYKAGLSGTRPLPPGVRIIDDFEAGNGHFTWTPTQSPTSVGAATSSFTVRTADDSYTKAYAQKIGVVDNPSDTQGWYVRHVSGGGEAANNTSVALTEGPDGSVGFFMRLLSNSDPSQPITTQLVLDGGAGGGAASDAGIPRVVIGDGEWHYYEWELDDTGQWTRWRDRAGNVIGGSDGVIPSTGTVSIDSIILRGFNVNAEFYLDGVMHNANGSLAAMLPVPEPGTCGLVLLAAGGFLRRGRRVR